MALSTSSNRDDLKAVRQRKYLARDFQALRAQLLEYARLYYPDRIRDFSESSMGGLLLDFAAYTGDMLSFYLDHQYGELGYDTAVETSNIERNFKAVGMPVTGASPAVVPVTVYIQVPAENTTDSALPVESCLPVVKAGSTFSSDSGVQFILLGDINFGKKRADSTYYASIKPVKNATGAITACIMALSGLCISGSETTEVVHLGSAFVPFRTVTLGNANVSEIISVIDGFGNTYYQVNALTNDVVYRNVLNTAGDNSLVPNTLKVIPAPYRYTAECDLASRNTVLTFGGGSADTLEDDVIPDPSSFALSLPYTKTFSRISVNPQLMLNTKTLGVISSNTSLQVTYRYGGGLNHNVPANTINTINTLNVFFPGNPSAATAASIKGKMEVNNSVQAAGGEDAPTVDDLKAMVPAVKNSQERIVSKEDLLARVYTMPTNFGRVFRAAIRSNPNNPLSSQLFITSRDADSKLTLSPDSLKRNIRTYLNPYRMISDAIDVLDVRIINYTFSFEVLLDPSLNRSVLLQTILAKLQTFFDITNFHIDQPIVMSDVVNNIFTVNGVVSVSNLLFNSISGVVNNRTYSQETYDMQANTSKGVIFPPPGAIFECRYPEYDVIGRASV